VKHSAARAFVALPMFAVFMFASPAHAEPFYAGGQRAGADVDRIVAFVNDAIAVSIERAVVTNIAAWVASIPPPAPPSPPAHERSARAPDGLGGGGESTGACGGATNGADRFIHRESGGNPNIFNTQGSGAYGCYQILASTWRSSCSDLGPEVGSSAATQAACASRLPLSAWGG
jgi:hypothetical protein